MELLHQSIKCEFIFARALKLGHGGDTYIASLLGMDPHTVARGRQELTSGDLSSKRVRAAGGGRLLQEKKRPKS